jgi:hypothetical protein
MRSLNVKRVAAVAAGALIVGSAIASAFAACPTLEKSFFFNDDGTPAVEIVIGENSMDGIPAGNLAAVIGNKAYVMTEEGEAGAGAGSGTVAILDSGITGVAGGSGATIDLDPSQETTLYDGNGNTQWVLTKSNAPFLKSGTLKFGTNEYNYNEVVRIDPSDQLSLSYQENDDYAEVMFLNGDQDIIYSVDFTKVVPDQTSITGAPEMYWLGSKYIVNTWDVDGGEVELIKGQSLSLGIGASQDVAVGEDTYTVTLDNAHLDEASSIGYADVTVTCPNGSEESLSLDTSSNTDGTACTDFLVYLEAATKSYTPGEGGRAKIRVGGAKFKLEDGAEYPGDDRWTVDFELNSASDSIDELQLEFDEDYAIEDHVTEIDGPYGSDPYFVVKYAGTQNPPTQEIVVKESSDVISKVSYQDKEGDTNTFTVQKSDGTILTHFVEANEDNDTDNDTVWLYTGNSEAFAVGDEVVEYVSADTAPDTALSTSSVRVTLRAEGQSQQFYPDYLLEADGSTVETGDTATTAWFNDLQIAGETVDMIMCLDSGYEDDAWEAVDTNLVDLDNVGPEAGTAGTYDNNTEDYMVDIDGDGTGSETDASCTGYLFVDTANVDVATDAPIDPLAGTGGRAGTAGRRLLDTAYADDMIYVGYENNAGTDDTTVFIDEETAGDGNNGQLSVWYDDSAADKGLDVYFDTTQDYDGDDGTAIIHTSKSDVKEDDKNGMSEFGSAITDASSGEITIVYPDEQLKLYAFAGQEEGTSTEEGVEYTITSDDTFPYEITDRVSVTGFEIDATCEAMGGAAVKPVGTIVIGDSDAVSGNAVVLGGHLVNMRAEGFTNTLLVDENSDPVCKFSGDGTVLYAAGWNRDQSAAVVDDIIDQIVAFA